MSRNPWKISGRLVLDTMTNEASLSYGAHPDRIFILNADKIAFMSGPGPFQYDLNGAEDWIRSYVRTLVTPRRNKQLH